MPRCEALLNYEGLVYIGHIRRCELTGRQEITTNDQPHFVCGIHKRVMDKYGQIRLSPYEEGIDF